MEKTEKTTTDLISNAGAECFILSLPSPYCTYRTTKALLYVLEPVSEIAISLTGHNFCPLHEVACTLAHFMNWVGGVTNVV
jgi:hypothetical protein